MSDDHSARLGLPYLAAGQMQKHVTLNEALTRLDALTQTAVISRGQAAQPGDPDDGEHEQKRSPGFRASDAIAFAFVAWYWHKFAPS